MINLMQGDCLERMKEIESGSCDMILTDPPYGTTACKWDSIIPLEPMWEQLKRIIKPNGAIVLFGSEPFSSALRMSNIKNYKYDWVWQKTRPAGHLVAKKRPMSDSECISVFNSKIYKPQMIKRDKERIANKKAGNDGSCVHTKFEQKKEYKRALTHKYPRTILKFSNSERGLHPTQKPVALMEYLIKTYTNETETVLDFTMGSGTTGVACKNLNRKFIGIELDQDYFNIAKKRIEEA